MKTIKMHKGTSKRTWIIILCSILVLAIGTYVVMSVLAWQSMAKASEQASADLKTAIDTTLATETPPESVPVAIQKTLDDYHASVSENPCELQAAYNWQATLPWFKDDKAACEEAVASSEEAVAALEGLLNFMNADSVAATKLTEAVTTTSTSTDYATNAGMWQKLADDPTLIADGNFKLVGANLAEVSKAIADAYTALVTASAGEDKTAFDTAEKGLSAAYSRLDEPKALSTEVQANLVDVVLETYNNL